MVIRNFHRWVSIVIAAPLLVIISTGLLLATRSFNPWMQPTYQHGSNELKVTFEQILKAAKSVPKAHIRNWGDVSQIDIRPRTAFVRVRSKTGHWEIQIDGATGKVLGVAKRRVSWIMAIHQGATFGRVVRYGIFLPSACGLLFLWISGLILFYRHLRMRRRHMSRRSAKGKQVP